MLEWFLENLFLRIHLRLTPWLQFSLQQLLPKETPLSLSWVDQPVGLGSQQQVLGPYELLDWAEYSSSQGEEGFTLRLFHRPTGLCLLRRCILLPKTAGLRLEGEIAEPGYGAITLSAIWPWRLPLEGTILWSSLQVQPSSGAFSLIPLPALGREHFTVGLQTGLLPGIVMRHSEKDLGGVGLFVGWPGVTEVALEASASQSNLVMRLEGPSFAHTLAPGERFVLPETYLFVMDTLEQLENFLGRGGILSPFASGDSSQGYTLFVSLEDLEQGGFSAEGKLRQNPQAQTIAFRIVPPWPTEEKEFLISFLQEVRKRGYSLALYVDLDLFGCIAHRPHRERLKRILLRWAPWVDRIFYSIPSLPDCSHPRHTHQPTDGRWANLQAHLSLLRCLAEEGQGYKVFLCVPRNQIWPSSFASLIKGCISGIPLA